MGLIFLTAPYDNDIHVGYLLGEMVWGKGYASKLLSGLVSHIPKKNGYRIMGGILNDNPASTHLLRKIGFQSILELSDAEKEIFGITLN
ncbi:MAG: GNAT family N-acetyltransferase [Paracoccaceae bacterium]